MELLRLKNLVEPEPGDHPIDELAVKRNRENYEKLKKVFVP